MPRAPKPYVASCEHPGCPESKRFAGDFANPREYLEAKGWYAAARSRGPTAWYCPAHVPRGNPQSVGSTTPCAPCAWALRELEPGADPTAPRDAVCTRCGRRELRRPSGDDTLDDYAATVAKFARAAKG